MPVRPVSDRLVPLPGTRLAPSPARALSPYAARAYGAAGRIGEREPRRDTPGTALARRPDDQAAEASRSLLTGARPAAPGVETEVSIRMYADGGSISVVRHLRGGETVGIEAVIR